MKHKFRVPIQRKSTLQKAVEAVEAVEAELRKVASTASMLEEPAERN